ncbi:hypothetical protein KM043_001366 [Ampulex compressa]|uniref:Regucalcin n=1 Tax=Ampulex compressa TaxID=860918 RepID=A0A1W6EW18_AMPCP|nr:regucalcin-like protein 1 [Ampulex compressa]KAG7213994.1 hypothetical protein KM043_001366 [Ampulex compressa]
MSHTAAGLLFGLLLVLINYSQVVIARTGINIQQVTSPVEHAEGPHWDHNAQWLYFVDIVNNNIYKYDPSTKNVTRTYLKTGPVGFVIPVNGTTNQFVAGSGRSFVHFVWDTKYNNSNPAIRTLAIVDQNEEGNRWNDGKADVIGRFWGGTIGPEVNDQVVAGEATLYRIDSNFVPVVEVRPVTNSNGLAWSSDNTKFYYIDTPTLQVVVYDFDFKSGTISNRRVAFDLAANNIQGLPDGMTIDADGNLFVAVFNGGCVIHVNPRTRKLLRIIPMPAEKVTSVTFGGPELDILYVTTSRRDVKSSELQKQPLAGSVFAVTGLGVHGLPANSFKMNCDTVRAYSNSYNKNSRELV